VKIAFDENVPATMVRVFQTFANESQLRKLTGEFEIKSARDYTPNATDPDYVRKSDVPWLKRFAADGGKVIISGNTDMKAQSHERLALIECGFVVFFFESQWSNWKFFRKSALLLHWWPEIAAKIKYVTLRKVKVQSFWHIPSSWPEKGKLRRISNQDPKLLRIERNQKRARKRKAKPEARRSDGPLFEWKRPEEEQKVKARPQTETQREDG
jgi:hypothetical protein